MYTAYNSKVLQGFGVCDSGVVGCGFWVVVFSSFRISKLERKVGFRGHRILCPQVSIAIPVPILGRRAEQGTSCLCMLLQEA